MLFSKHIEARGEILLKSKHYLYVLHNKTFSFSRLYEYGQLEPRNVKEN